MAGILISSTAKQGDTKIYNIYVPQRALNDILNGRNAEGVIVFD